ncbi:DUF5071 domain-containing protein [Paenibacillus illinoisensis]|uniref:DUF5071 domain-containing protein n=1 Tax=Paenibacillus illinoisensis TaxID=59845 RepID=UPI00203D37EF|nr:DUF5071 domain-containing protein [Paenibacillus illinoisensis]MCM3204789.1 DUF5071 domain-containing protein [Paenibacillus illinoisensis]
MINDARLNFILSPKEYLPYLPELLEGIQDINWPNAYRIVEFLNKHDVGVAPYVKTILLTEDTVWRYWMLTEIVSKWSKNTVEIVKSELLVIAELLDIYEETDLESLDILLTKGIVDWTDVRSMVVAKEETIHSGLSDFTTEQIEEFNELEKLRQEIIQTDISLISRYVQENEQALKMKNKYATLSNYLVSLESLKIKHIGTV